MPANHQRNIEEDAATERTIFGLVVLYGILSLLISFKFLFIVGVVVALWYWLF